MNVAIQQLAKRIAESPQVGDKVLFQCHDKRKRWYVVTEVTSLKHPYFDTVSFDCTDIPNQYWHYACLWRDEWLDVVLRGYGWTA